MISRYFATVTRKEGESDKSLRHRMIDYTKYRSLRAVLASLGIYSARSVQVVYDLKPINILGKLEVEELYECGKLIN